MLKRREGTRDWVSALVYRVLPLPQDVARMNELFPEETVMEAARPFYDDNMGRPSEDPVVFTKLLFLSFFCHISGDCTILQTLKYRLDWRQFCGLSLFDALPTRTTLVKFRTQVGAAVVAAWFADVVEGLKARGLMNDRHRFFDGTPAKAHARINPYRDEMYDEPLDSISAKLDERPLETVELTPDVNPSPVDVQKNTYSVDQQAIKIRRKQSMKPVAERQSAGDPDAHFQRGKHGKPSELGYELFFTTDSEQLCIEQVDVSSEAGQGQRIFAEKLKQSTPGQEWSVDAEFSTGPLLKLSETRQVILNTPPRTYASTGMFTKSEFMYQADSESYTCPNRQTLSHVSTNGKTEDKTYRAAKGVCHVCPLREQCTTSKTGRSVTRSTYEEQFARQREHEKTAQAVMGRVLRGIIAEGKFGEALRHGLKELRYVGRTMAVMHTQLVATILNLKRLIRIEQAGILLSRETHTLSRRVF